MTQRRRREVLVLAGAFLLALAMRLLPVPAATRGGLRLLSPDCYGHLRRARFAALHFPSVLVRDPYLNPPAGAVWIWPPGFDLLIAAGARLAYGARPTTAEVTAVAAVLPPFLGALHVLPLFAFARRLFGRRRARIAVFAYALLPSAVLWSCFGHADQHVAEGLALLLFLAAAARAADPDLPPREKAGRALLAGLAMALALLVWQGAVFVAGLGLLWAFLALGEFAVLTGGAAAAVTAAAVALTLHGATVPFSFVSFGWFQPLLVAAGTLPLAILAAVRARSRGGRIAAIATAVVLAALVAPDAQRLLGAVARGGTYVTMKGSVSGADDFADGGYLSYPPELMNLIAESKPLLARPLAPALLAAARELSVGFLVLPFALLLWGARVGFRRIPGGRRAARLLAILFGAALLAMTLVQRRNVYYLAIFAALALAEAAVRAARTRRRALPALAAAGAVLVLAIPAYREVAAYPASFGRDFMRLLTELRALDPPPADPFALPLPAPGAVASVMAPWSAGHLVTLLVERPAAADNFEYGWRRQARLFTTSDPAEAWLILREARCRYLVTADLGPRLFDYAAAVGNGAVPAGAMFLPRVHFSADPHPFPFLTRVLDGRTGSLLPGGRFLPRYRVYRVEGAADGRGGSPPP